jgi:T1SS-143 domain-containing protein
VTTPTSPTSPTDPDLDAFDVRVSEEGLPGGNRDTTGSQDTTNAAAVTGAVPLSGVSDLSQVSFALTAPVGTLTANGEPVTWSGEGTATLIGSANGTEVLRISIDAAGNYTVELSGAVDHSTLGEGDLALVFGVTATVPGQSPVAATLTVTVEDDAPVVAVTDAIVSNAEGATVVGTLTEGGADMPVGLTLNGTPPVGLTSFGQAVEYSVNGSTLTATAGGNLVFTLQANADGTYSFELHRPLDLSGYSTDFTAQLSPGGPNTYYLFDDGSFAILDPEDSGNWWVRISGTSEDGTPGGVNPSAQGMGVDNNWLDDLEEIRFDFDDEGESGQANLVYFARIGVNGADAGESLSYTAYYSDGSSMTVNGATLVDGNLEIQSIPGAHLDAITLRVSGEGSHVAVRLMTLETFTLDEAAPLDLGFSFTGQDADGDPVSGDFSVTVQNSPELLGGLGNDAIGGGAGSEVIYGGAGNDVLTGGLGSDVFAWDFGDQGTTAQPAVDRITDFSMADTPDGGDVLDLADLLVDATGDTIGNYIGFEKSGDDTVVKISSAGQLEQGADQLIVLEGVDLTSIGNDQAIITDLVTRGKLIIE